ncbi:methyl-accepting chemotaxis protein [Candidatus Haliotispira prima]|uniref:Methyl-accepting chemotaxis protein n=1 Tax=Candidatus Haliotispira prima TaxID=3034016 RepID=A0ABY8MDS7_9SPIO|nr:methyl-accepting chemotaxis protein [Candidatus Haliotispira prima]
MIVQLARHSDGETEDTEPLLHCLYKKQKALSSIFLSYAFFYSIATTTDWFSVAVAVSGEHWLIRLNTFLVNFSLGLLAFRLFNLSVIRLIGNVMNRFEIALMGNRKPLNMAYESLITAILMGVFCIVLTIYIDTLTTFHGNIVIDSFLRISENLNEKNIPLDNFLITNIIKREVSQQTILIMGVDPYSKLNEVDSLAVFRGVLANNAWFYIIMFYIMFLFVIYFMRSIYLVNRMIYYLSGYLRGVLEGVTSLRKVVPLLRFDTLGYMTGYLNLLFRHIHKIIMNLVSSVIELSDTSESSIADSAGGTNEVYNLTHNFASISLKADLQLQSIQSIREAFNDLREIIKSINNEVSIQKRQLESAKDTVNRVKTAIVEMEQSSKNVAKLFEKLSSSAGSGLDIVQNNHHVMEEIFRTSYSIRDIVSSIEKISGQTGLLAMSASIESAHAGNHGLGFSVVAQSVRNLSDDSGIQSKAIRAQIEEMVRKVEVGVLLSRHVSRSFQLIVNSTQTSATLFHHIYNSIDEQNKQSVTINSEIEELLATTEEILSSTREQVGVLDELTETTINLEREIKTISMSSQRQSNMSEKVVSLFESLNSQVVLNTERVYSINEKINRFELD